MSNYSINELKGQIAVLILLVFIGGTAFGWIMNIISLIQGSYESISTIIVGCIGVIIPILGALVYYLAG